MAKATLGDRTVVDWDGFAADYDLIREAIEAVFPIFQGYNARRIRIRRPPTRRRERIWATPSGKGGELPGLRRLRRDPHRATWSSCGSARSEAMTSTIRRSTRCPDRHRGVFGQRDVVFLNEYEMKRRDLPKATVWI